MALSGVGLVACGSTSAAPATPPTATEILAKPEHSNLSDAHFTMTFSDIPLGNGVSASGTGDGSFAYKPQPAARIVFRWSAGGQTFSLQVLTVGGMDYIQLTPGPAKWTASPSTSNPATLTDSTGASFVGEESLPQGKAWHVKAKDKDGNPFDVWVRESDGYPLKYITKQTTGTGTFTLVFDKYNTGDTVSPPPAAQIQAS